MVGIKYYFRCSWSEPGPESNLSLMHLMIVPSFILWHGHLSAILYLRFGEVAIWSQPWQVSDTTSDVAGLSLFIKPSKSESKDTTINGLDARC
nr:hypothetical protein [Tanacetum cinerariifolium]